MKNTIRLFILVFVMTVSCYLTYGQNLPNSNFSSGNADLDALGRNPTLDFVFQQYRSKKNKLPLVKYEGSPFLIEDFKKADIYVEDSLVDRAYMKYDGYNDEIQLKKILELDKMEMLLQRSDIYCLVEGEEILYKKYMDKKDKLKQGYLFKLFDIDDITLFERRRKKYKEGKEAATSLQIAVPNKFVEVFELYYITSEDKMAHFLKPSQKEILGLFKKDAKKTEAIKRFVSKYNLNLKKTDDIIKTFEYYNTL